MKYMLKQKLLAFGNDFDVFDENGRKLFYFDSKIGGFRPKIIIEDSTGKRLGQIKKKFFTFRPTYSIYDHTGLIAEVSKKNFSFRKSFLIKITGAEIIKVSGSFVEHNYIYYQGRQQVAEVSKKWFAGKDSYGIEIDRSDQQLAILSSAVVIDILCHPGRGA